MEKILISNKILPSRLETLRTNLFGTRVRLPRTAARVRGAARPGELREVLRCAGGMADIAVRREAGKFMTEISLEPTIN